MCSVSPWGGRAAVLPAPRRPARLSCYFLTVGALQARKSTGVFSCFFSSDSVSINFKQIKTVRQFFLRTKKIYIDLYDPLNV